MIDLHKVITKNCINNIINECKRVSTIVSISMGGKHHLTMEMLQ